jgi:DNA primase
MWEEAQKLKRQFSLLDYLRHHHWIPRQVGSQQEFVGLCPLHPETHPSFYVNAAKNLFYCHGCGRGGDVIRFTQLYFDLPFHQAVARLQQELAPGPACGSELLQQAVAFYQTQLHRHREALQYLHQRGLHDSSLIQRLGIGYASGGNLRRHLTALGYPFELLREVGLVDRQGRDTLYRRIVFPCRDRGYFSNLYGRSLDAAPAHRFLARPKGGLHAWETVSAFPSTILVEGLFDLAVLWQAGFLNTTCALGTQLTVAQLRQLCDRRDRQVFLVFDSDANYAGQQAAQTLAQRLHAAGLTARLVELPQGHDPNSYFAAGATSADFARCLEQAQEVRQP